MIEVAALCIGAGILLDYSARSRKMDAELLSRATHVDKLKGLEEFLEKKPLYRSVVVRGIVGSTSPMENNYGGASGVFFMRTASLRFERMTITAPAPEYKCKVVNRKEVPWYLEDNTARVNVKDYQESKGFIDILKKHVFTEPVKKHFESLLSVKEIKIPDDSECKCCDHILEIGTRLTVVGKAERDRDGTPTIGQVYLVFNDHIDISEVVHSLESSSVLFERWSSFLAAMGVVLLAASVLHDALDIKELVYIWPEKKAR